MRIAAKRTGLLAVSGLALLAAVISLVAWMGTTASDNPAEANHQMVLGIDTNITGNTALALGTTEACRVLSSTSSFSIDIYVKGVDDISAFEINFKYDTAAISISKPGSSAQGQNSLFMLQQAQPSPPGNNFNNFSAALPNTNGVYVMAGFDSVPTPSSPDPDPVNGSHMDGVLIRMEIKGKSSFVTFPGQSTILQISTFINPGTGFPQGPTIKDSALPSNFVGDYDGDGFVDNVINATLVSAGGTCSDTDGDGVPDSSDNCPTVNNSTQTDTDGDGQGDVCDIDDDNDGLVDSSEPGGCELDPDCDNDNVSDGPNDPDSGGPIVAGPDNCIQTANTLQTNTDGDALGNACDPDDDNDTVLDGADNCPLVINPGQSNFDGDSQGDACDDEDDGDGYTDANEALIGTNPMDNCGEHTTTPPIYSQSFPSDVYSSFPSTNLITIQDLTAFLVPIRRLGTSPASSPAGYDARWDIVPGSGVFGDWINIQDLTKIITLAPDMYGSVRAFGNPTSCIP